MTKQDNNFLEEFKKLEQLCNQMYGPHSGVTHYINIMSEVSSEKAHKIDGWYDDLKMLKHLRHIRNTLTHESCPSNTSLSERHDIMWLSDFYKRILSAKDPLSILNKKNRKHKNAAPKGSTESHVFFNFIAFVLFIVIFAAICFVVLKHIGFLH